MSVCLVLRSFCGCCSDLRSCFAVWCCICIPIVQLYKRFEATNAFERGEVLISWAPMDESANVMLPPNMALLWAGMCFVRERERE